MRYYNTLNKNVEFIVVQHVVKGTNTELLGIRYRDGYAVVAKNSKEHIRLKSIPRAVSKEFNITYLRQLKFITNPQQISYIWGRAVYQYYVKKMEEKVLQIEAIPSTEMPLCKGHNKDGTQCGNEKLKVSEYCRLHLFMDKRLADDFANRKKFMDKEEKKQFIDGLIQKLEKIQP